MRSKTYLIITTACLLLLLSFSPSSSWAKEQIDVILATTTSTYDTGLLDVIVPLFERLYPAYDLKPIAVGTGQALSMGRRGEADVLLVHAKAAEIKFINDGFGFSRRPVMYNDFIILGLKMDQALVKSASTIEEALMRIHTTKSKWVTRGDDSGTHKREKSLLIAADLEKIANQVETGAGMGHSLRVADELGAYILCDRGTYLALAHSLRLVPLFEGGEDLINRYSVIVVRPKEAAGSPKRRALRLKGANLLANFLRADGIQQRIRRFGIQKFGRILFYPDASPK